MTAGLFRARGRTHCSVIQKKEPGVSCGCCAKVKCNPSKAAMSMCAAKPFAFMATHLARSSSRANCEHNSNMKASESARRRVRCERHDRPAAAIWARSRARTGRCDDDRDWVDDRVGHLHHLSGIIAIERRTGLAPACVGFCWFVDYYRRVV